MPTLPMDDSLQLLLKGYGWLPDRRRAQARRTVAARLMGRPAFGLEGPAAARWFYDEEHVRRAGALPEPVVGTLFGKGAVHTLDGPAHRLRKGLFVDVLMDEHGIVTLVERARDGWDDAVKGWARRRQIVLFDEAAKLLAGAVTRWAGVPVDDDEVPSLARDLTALVDGFATAGPRHWRARRARGRREAWLSQIVQQVRRGELVAPEGSALEAVAHHRDSAGQQLDPRVAAVELINVIRPTTAIAWFLAFSGHALIRWPQLRDRLRGDPAYAEAFAHEVRRFYPFAPFLGGKAPREVEWDGQRIPEGALVLLDLYGQNHDAEVWGDPYVFRPDRFLGREIGAFELVPQGAGDPRTNHRCPGEQIVVAVLAALAQRLAELEVDVPEQDLTISLRRIPALPASRIVLQVR